METVRIRDRIKSDPGSGINMPDPQHRFLYESEEKNESLNKTAGCALKPLTAVPYDYVSDEVTTEIKKENDVDEI